MRENCARAGAARTPARGWLRFELRKKICVKQDFKAHRGSANFEPARISTLRGLIIVSIPKHSTLTARSLTRTLRSGEQQEPSHTFSLCYINVEVLEEVGGPKRTLRNPAAAAGPAESSHGRT